MPISEKTFCIIFKEDGHKWERDAKASTPECEVHRCKCGEIDEFYNDCGTGA